MRLAIFSDVHGNRFALETVLRAIAVDGSFDAVIAAGDLALGGADPAGCVDLIREAGALAVYGNTETYLTDPDTVPPDELHRKKWDHLRTQVDWALPILSLERVAWLKGLPFSLRFSPTPNAEEDLLVFHGNPKDIVDFIFPPPEQQPKYFGSVLQPDDDPTLARLMEGVTARTCAFGHMHISTTRRWREYTLVNVAPCALPSLEKDPRARYTIFEWVGHWKTTQKFLPYNFTREVDALKASGMPFSADFSNSYQT